MCQPKPVGAESGHSGKADGPAALADCVYFVGN
jgi:hypothetical protein